MLQGTVDGHDKHKNQIQINVVEANNEDNNGRNDEFTDEDARASGTKRILVLFKEERTIGLLVTSAASPEMHQGTPDFLRIHGHSSCTSSR